MVCLYLMSPATSQLAGALGRENLPRLNHSRGRRFFEGALRVECLSLIFSHAEIASSFDAAVQIAIVSSFRTAAKFFQLGPFFFAIETSFRFIGWRSVALSIRQAPQAGRKCCCGRFSVVTLPVYAS